MKISRRVVLRGIGGAALSLPFLEGLVPRHARAGVEVAPYAVFFRQANGVAQEANSGEIGEEPERFFVPAYVGYRGWIGVRLDRDVDWKEIDGVVRDAYCMVAPKTVVAALRGER